MQTLQRNVLHLLKALVYHLESKPLQKTTQAAWRIVVQMKRNPPTYPVTAENTSTETSSIGHGNDQEPSGSNETFEDLETADRIGQVLKHVPIGNYVKASWSEPATFKRSMTNLDSQSGPREFNRLQTVVKTESLKSFFLGQR